MTNQVVRTISRKEEIAQAAPQRHSTLRRAAEERIAREAAAKAEEQRARDDARQAEAAARFDREHKEPTKSAWLANGGTVAEFEAVWPQLRVNLLAELSFKAQEKARAATGQWTRSNF